LERLRPTNLRSRTLPIRQDLLRLSRGLPRVRAVLRQACEGVQQRLGDSNTRSFVEGIDDCLKYFEKMEAVFERHRRLRPAIILIRRLSGDFQSALVGLTVGSWKVVYDLMRDVFEIELLLRDFADDPTRFEEWFNSSDNDRWKRFSPILLRRRTAARLGVTVDQLTDSEDYRNHSSMLHVVPSEFPVVGWGLSKATILSSSHVCFWDVIEHAWRSSLCVHHFVTRATGSRYVRIHPTRFLRQLPALRRACRTAQWISMAATTAPPKRIPPLEVMIGDPRL
jgi:hypothetical protein